MSVVGQPGSDYRAPAAPIVEEPAIAAAGMAYDRSSRAHRWGVAMVHRRRLVLALWALALIASAALYPSLQHALGAPDYLVAGSQSARVEKLVEKRFPEVGTEDDAIVFQSHRYTTSDRPYSQFIASLDAVIAHQRGVKGVLGPFDEEAVGQISPDERSAVAAVALTGDSQQRFENAAHLQSAVARAVHASNTGIGAWLTGYSPVTKDLVKVQTHDVERAERLLRLGEETFDLRLFRDISLHGNGLSPLAFDIGDDAVGALLA